jgi:hypothetical protein
MPKSTQHALITWIPNSKDGEREARNLNGVFRNYSVLQRPDKLTAETLSDYLSLIVVGHRGEFSSSILDSLSALLRPSHCHWLVLAMCSSAEAAYQGPLQDNELWTPAQRLSNELRIRVSGTKRALLFDEVGKGYAFALAIGEILIRSDPPNSPELWKDCEPQSEIDEITDGLSRL